jgi:hypothetical protein
MDTDDDPSAFSRNLAYRIAYGLASRRIERDRIGPNAPGRDLGLQLDRLVAWTLAEMGGDHELAEAVAEGVRDALKRRRPRW